MKDGEIRKLWQRCFPDISAKWFDSFMSSTYRQSDLRIDVDTATDSVVSALLVQPYDLELHGRRLLSSYLSFACTDPRFRGTGRMTQLLKSTIRRAYDDGVSAIMLIPAHEWLRDYYRRAAQFATVVYSRQDCYSSVHSFPTGYYSPSDDEPTADLAEAFGRFSVTDGYSLLLHSERDFAMVMADCRMEGGRVASVIDADGRIAAVALAYPDEYAHMVTVKAAVGESAGAVDAVLEMVRRLFPGMSLRVIIPAGDDNTGWRKRHLIAGGMARVVNAHLILDTVAKAAPRGWSKVVRISDPVVEGNNHTYVLIGSEGVSVDDTVKPSSLQGFDISIDVLSQMVWGSKPIGELIDFPSNRLIMRLMLE